jgi:hypothetical protein
MKHCTCSVVVYTRQYLGVSSPYYALGVLTQSELSTNVKNFHNVQLDTRQILSLFF